MGSQTLQPPQKLLGTRRGVVETVNHGVLEVYAPPRGIVVPADGLHQFLNGIGLVYRHDLIADFIVWAMQGNGQADLQLFFRQSVDFRNQPAGGQTDVPHGNVHALRAVYQL